MDRTQPDRAPMSTGITAIIPPADAVTPLAWSERSEDDDPDAGVIESGHGRCSRLNNSTLFSQRRHNPGINRRKTEYPWQFLHCGLTLTFMALLLWEETVGRTDSRPTYPTAYTASTIALHCPNCHANP